MADCTDMDAKKHSNHYCSDKINKISFAVSVISLVLAALLFVEVDIVNRKAESMETKLQNRVQRMEELTWKLNCREWCKKRHNQVQYMQYLRQERVQEGTTQSLVGLVEYAILSVLVQDCYVGKINKSLSC